MASATGAFGIVPCVTPLYHSFHGGIIQLQNKLQLKTNQDF